MAKEPKTTNGRPEAPVGMVDTIMTQVKSGLLSTIATGIVTALVATLLTVWALVQQWPGKIGLTPSGAVMAFDLKEGCPPGWLPYPQAWGRFVIGAVATKDDIATMPAKFSKDARGVDLTPRPFGDQGGEELHLLKPEEMPKHSHVYVSSEPGAHKKSNGVPNPVFAFGSDAGLSPHETATTEVGGNDAHNNMPPFIALYFCKKD